MSQGFPAAPASREAGVIPPALAAVLAHLERELGALPVEDLPAAIGDLERLKAGVWARLLAPGNVATNGTKGPAEGDRLLKVEEAAHKLGMEVDYLYRHAKRFPFVVRPAPGQLRFSLLQIEKYIRLRQA